MPGAALLLFMTAMQLVTIIEDGDTATIAGWLARHLPAGRADAPVAIAMPGGSTPFPIIAALLARKPGPAWPAITVWPTDDRIVPEDHEASNAGKLRALIEPAGAALYPLTEAAVPSHFALTWLGMGADGHIASLFPNTNPQADDPQAIRCLTPDPLPPHAPFDRITLTIPALLDTDAVLLTLGGAPDKRAVFEQALAGGHDLPIARLLRAAAAHGVPVTVFA